MGFSSSFGLRRVCVLAAILALVLAGPLAAREVVVPGIDVLERDGFSILAGQRVGLITNHTGITMDNKSTIDVLAEAPNVDLVVLFSPEHGIRGTADEKVASGIDEKSGLHVNSLYGDTKKPTPEMLEGLDTLVFDMQDIGTRFYTYIGTMAMAMQAAKEHGKKFVVLDRPNTIGGDKVEGIVADKELTGGNTCIYPIPTRHGMTVGELAMLFNEHFEIGVDLHVVKMEGWDRSMYFDETGLLWINPSPNMKTLNGAILYPGLGAAETTWISCGRGTDRPFEMYGAPYMDGEKLAANLNARNIPGIRFVPYSFTPSAKYHKHEGKLCHGVFAIILDRDELHTTQAGLHMVQAMAELFPEDFKALGGFKTSWGNDRIYGMLTEQGMTPEAVLEAHQADLDAFLAVREKYLLY